MMIRYRLIEQVGDLPPQALFSPDATFTARAAGLMMLQQMRRWDRIAGYTVLDGVDSASFDVWRDGMRVAVVRRVAVEMEGEGGTHDAVPG